MGSLPPFFNRCKEAHCFFDNCQVGAEVCVKDSIESSRLRAVIPAGGDGSRFQSNSSPKGDSYCRRCLNSHHIGIGVS